MLVTLILVGLAAASAIWFWAGFTTATRAAERRHAGDLTALLDQVQALGAERGGSRG
jgi:type II secretory pathway pseudopilin PulG